MTLINESTTEQLTACVETSPKMQSKVIPAIVSKQVKQNEASQDNMCRSLKSYMRKAYYPRKSTKLSVEISKQI